MDNDPSVIYYSIGLLVSLFASIFFSIIKIIFSSTDKDSLPIDDEKLRYYISKIDTILENKSKFSVTVSCGKTFFNIVFSILLFLLIIQLLPEKAYIITAISTIIITTVFLSLLAYSIPRAFILFYHNRFIIVSYHLYILFRFFFSTLASIMLVSHTLILKLLHFDEKFAFLSDNEKSRLNDSDTNEDALDIHEKKMIRRIFDLGETTVKEIMLPRVDIKALDITTDYQTVLSTVRDAGHSRIPVFKGNIDSIVGILYAKDILSWICDNPDGEWNLERLLKKPQFVPTSKKIDDLMHELKKNHIHIAIVVDEYGGTAGIVTMEDIIEEIVGDIKDEYDSEEEPVIKISENIYHIKPQIELDNLAEIINIPLNVDDVEYNTLSGLFYQEYGEVPKENTEFEFNGLRLKIIKMDNQRIK
ncbi:MAG: hemolysin family protein, partial [Chitinispirillia bacterium]